ncbi:MAG TPA: M90 family metallopeptidase [Chthonomonadaceae bacterium]|nr:M90 family metallopeptidase [Chthonomonadaceae bacterium]
MIFDWIREHHRKELLAAPFPAEWAGYLERNVSHYALLNQEERAKLQDDLRVFAHEKSWEGCGGFEMTDEARVTIAGLACLLVLARPHDYFANVESILVYPTGYVARDRAVGPDGVVREGPSARLGEAWRNGPVVLSWLDVKTGAMNGQDGRNVVLHEFAHKLDLTDGSANGVPRLKDDAQYEQWADVMSAEYERLVRDVEHGHATLLDEYAATNAAEFFAVATECFFEKSPQMRETHADLYEVLKAFYNQDPAER